MHCSRRVVVLLALLIGPAASIAPTAQDAGPPKASTDTRLSTMSGFTIDYPKKDWTPLAGAGSSLIVFFHKTREATVAVERTKVGRPLAPSDITEQTATLEVEDWQNRRPQASGFSHQFMEYAGTRLMIIDFSQPGSQGPERVRMYTMPRGVDWYRVICTTTQSSFEKYRETCHKIALSLTPTQP